MENVESQRVGGESVKKGINRPLTVVSCVFLTIGLCGGPLLIRLYYLHGGKRRWIAPCMQTAGFPILVLPLIVLFIRQRSKTTRTQQGGGGQGQEDFFLDTKLCLLAAVVGLCIGLVDFCYSLGVSYLPVSTSSILFNTQLAFVSVFAWVIVKIKFTPYIFNSVVLMTLGSILLGLGSQGDRPAGVSNGQYLAGFFLTLAAAALIGLMWPCIEFFYSKSARPMNYTMFLQFQLILNMLGTIFNIVGMLISKDFQAMGREANEYDLGHGTYYVALVATAVVWQISFLGGFGLIFFTSSLFSGIMTAVLLPLSEVAAVIAYHESFNAEKGMSLALCLWGFISYFYGEYITSNKMNNLPHQGEE